MPALQALLDRFYGRPNILTAAQEFEAFEKSEKPLLEKAWHGWAQAQKAMRSNRPDLALAWLAAAQRSLGDEPDQLCALEVTSTRAQLLRLLDEPRDAIGPAMSAWRGWLALAQEPRAEHIVPSVRTLLAVLSEPHEAPEMVDEDVLLSWMCDRFSREFEASARQLMSVFADLCQPGAAAEVAGEYRAWVDKYLPTQGALGSASGAVHAKLLIALGDIYDRCGDSQKAYTVFQEGLELLSHAPGVEEVVGMRGQLHFNSGNQLGKLERYCEALEEFQAASEDLSGLGNSEALLRVRYAVAFLHYKQGQIEGLDDELADLAEKYEGELEEARSGADQVVIRQGLDRVYRLWLRLSVERIDLKNARQILLFFHQLFALKEEEGKLSRFWKHAMANPDAAIHSEISVLVDRVDQRQGTGILVIEQVPDALIFVSFRAGTGPWNTRVHIAVVEDDEIEAVKNLILEHRQAVHSLADRSMPVRWAPSSSFRSACNNAWNVLTDEIQKDIASVDTLMVSVDNQTELDELPLELLHDGTTYLGLRINIVWVPALRDLNLLLGDNRMNAAPTECAIVMRAQDELPQANAEAKAVGEGLEYLGVRSIVRTAPDQEQLLGELGEGVDLLHYIGHGLADEIGEELPLGSDQRLTARAVGAIQPAPAPLTILSACLAGRGRQLRTGHQQGFATALLRRGAASVVAAKYLLPDHIATEYATLLYHFAAEGTLQFAVRETRATLADEGYHPAAWSCFVIFGRPGVRLQAPHRCDAKTWPSAVFRYLATGSNAHLKTAQRLLEKDLRLSDKLKLQLQKDLAALDSGDPQYFSLEKMAEPSGLDAFSEAMMARTMVLAFGAMRHASGIDGPERQKLEHDVIQQAILAEKILGDNYLLVAAAIEMCQRTEFHRQGEGKDILLRATRSLRWLSGDESELESAAFSLKQQLKQVENTLLFDIPTLAGVDNETFRAADSGDRQAQKNMLRNLLTSEASPEALTSRHWTEWMLRVIGTGGRQSVCDVLGSIVQAGRSGRITTGEQHALNELIEQYFGPGEVNPTTAEAALSAFRGKEPEESVVELFLFHDRLASGSQEVTIDEIWAALEKAEGLKAKGAMAYFRAVWAQWAVQANRPREAFDAGMEALEAFQQLASDDPEYEVKLGMVALLTSGIANACGEQATASMLVHRYRNAIAAFQAENSS